MNLKSFALRDMNLSIVWKSFTQDCVTLDTLREGLSYLGWSQPTFNEDRAEESPTRPKSTCKDVVSAFLFLGHD